MTPDARKAEREAQDSIKRCRQDEKAGQKPPVYIVVYQYRPKGFDWTHNQFLIHPQVFGSISEAQACLELCGFDHLFRHRPELRDRQLWKVTAAYENARVWIKQERRRRKERANT